MDLHHHLSNVPIREEIERIVGSASRRSGFVRAGEQAYRLSKQFPDSGVSGTQLVNAIIAEAAFAGVAVEIYQPAAEPA